MGFLDFFGLGKKKGSSGSQVIQPLMPDWQMGLGEDLSSWVRKFLQLYQPGKPYPGNFPSPAPSTFEQTGLNQLGDYLKAPGTGDLFAAGKGQILDTLSGKYADPAQSPFIQAATRLANQNLQDAITTARGQRGARGTYFTTAGIQEESRLTERTLNALNSVIGDFINQERGRQLTAAPEAQALDQYVNQTIPTQKINAAMTAGSLPRLLEQADFERHYADFKRQQDELSQVPGVGTQVFGTRIPLNVQNTAPSASIPNMLSQILGGIDLGGLFGGGSSEPSSGGKMSTGNWVNIALKLLPIILAAG